MSGTTSGTPMANAEAALAADHAYADPALWITRIPDEVIRDQARTLEAEGERGRPLWGVCFAVKDNIDVAGVPTTAACPGYSYTPQVSAPPVQRLLDAGAILLGKTNLDQFATGLVGVRSPYGIPRNVFDPARVPGGSSSGSACAVAAGIAAFALGTDTAGSGRVPAGFGNIVGLKPTIGSVSAMGIVPACRSIDTISVFSRTVDEGLAVLRVIAAFDGEDRYSRPAPHAHLRRSAAALHGRIGVIDGSALCSPAVASVYRDVAANFPAAVTVDISEYLAIARLLYDGPWVAERTAALRDMVERRPAALHPVTRRVLEQGFDRRTVDAFDAFHDLAQARHDAAALFEKIDALLLPTAPFCPTLAELAADPIGPNTRLGTFTNFVNLCDLAAIAVPGGFGADGLPVGVTLVGPAWSEGRLAATADAIHRAATQCVGATATKLPPAAPPDGLAPDEMALFCIGAHMSGLPLNEQVTGLGGRFLREARTISGYCLFDLGARPGLIRATAGASGGAVAGEVWALPAASIGPLLAMVPPPLSFGTVALEDGPCCGFLAESAGLAGAPDITGHGGWRAWLATSKAGINGHR